MIFPRITNLSGSYRKAVLIIMFADTLSLARIIRKQAKDKFRNIICRNLALRSQEVPVLVRPVSCQRLCVRGAPLCAPLAPIKPGHRAPDDQGETRVQEPGETSRKKARAANDNAAGRRVIVLFPPDLPVNEAELQLAETWLSGIIAGLAGAAVLPPDNDNSG